MAESLRGKTLKGMIWSFAENFSLQGIQFIIGILLARVLSPSDYGMVGMLAIFTAVSQTLINSGFSTALVRKNDRTQTDLSTTFYFNIVVGFVLYFVLFFSGSLIANFYNTPLLSDLIKVTAISLILNSLCIVQQALFTIKMDFKTQAKISVIGALVTGAGGITMAYTGFGVWSIVWPGVFGGAVRCILLWIWSKWRPTWEYSWKSFRELFGFGSKLLIAGIIASIYDNLYSIVIAKKFSATSLGYYTRAEGYSSLPATTISHTIHRVTFPLLCQIQDDNNKLQSTYRQLIALSAFIVFPIMIWLATLAKPLITIMITDKWIECVPYLQILCIAKMLYPIHILNNNLLQVKGRSDLFLKIDIAKKIVGVIVLIITARYGIIWMCIGILISYIIFLFINTYYTGKLINIGLKQQLKDILPSYILSISMGGIIWGITKSLDSYTIQIIIGSIIGILYYISTAYIFKLKELLYLQTYVINNFKGKL
ncbi:MAG: lipopolysaccharide biosynthesis protein [Bacteroidales bacterium]|nr:lipopolysaccharide biosynthesis protein [Bacteroidales bacterium]